MAPSLHDTIMLTTPRGHEVLAQLDYRAFELRAAKAIHHYTGVVTALDDKTSHLLSRALKAKQIYEMAVAETHAAHAMLERMSELTRSNNHEHPVLAPYWHEAQQHQTIAEDMRHRAKHFHDSAMAVIDRTLEAAQ